MHSGSTLLLIDAHVHLYQQYNLNLIFRSGVENLINAYKKTGRTLPDQTVAVWLLTERHDCRFFNEIQENPELFKRADRHVRMGGEPGAVLIRQDNLPDLYILAGRQLVSTDGLEVLALTGWEKCPDRACSTADLIRRIDQCGALSVLNWAPGKWFFRRGGVVRDLIRTLSIPPSFLIGDTPLRHALWMRPRLMREAQSRGIHLIAGSDPLPFRGEEFMIGTYGNAIECAFNPNQPVTSIRQILKDSDCEIRIIGKRNNPFQFAWREVKILLN